MGSKTYIKLLSYLVEASMRDEMPKEYSIATDVFGKDTDFNPGQDSTVRVYVGNLRKKLERYYRTEGKKAKIQIEIPRGHYGIKWVKNSPRKRIDILLTSPYFRVFILLFIVAALIFVTLRTHLHEIITSYQQIRITREPFWADFISSKFPKIIVLGDDYFFLEMLDGEETIIRKHYINSDRELEEFRAKNQGKEIIGKTDYPFFPRNSIWALPEIIKAINYSNNFSLQYSSNLKTTDLLKNDIIFLGTFRNLYLLDRMFKVDELEYQLGGDSSYLKIKLPDSSFTFIRMGNPKQEHTDYCLVRKIPGPNGNILISFTSFFEAGMSGAAHFMTNQATLRELNRKCEKQFGYVPKYFDVLFKTSGYSRTAFSTRIEYIREIDKNQFLW